MNDPNEGIETVFRLRLSAVPALIEMNDPNEGIETNVIVWRFI